MTTTSLDPARLDQQAAVLYDTAAWQAMVDGWTTPVADRPPTPDGGADLVAAVPGLLLTKTTTELIADAGIRTGPAPRERELPGRIAALVPDRLHTWRRLYQPDLKPSVQLGYAARLLEEWGWQNQPYQLRSISGARCVCGALLSCHRMGLGSNATTERSAAYVLGELRTRNWAGLIGEWNRQPGRTADHAISLLTAAADRAHHTGH